MFGVSGQNERMGGVFEMEDHVVNIELDERKRYMTLYKSFGGEVSLE